MKIVNILREDQAYQNTDKFFKSLVKQARAQAENQSDNNIMNLIKKNFEEYWGRKLRPDEEDKIFVKIQEHTILAAGDPERGTAVLVKCDCGNKIYCYNHINRCEKCGRQYKYSGQAMNEHTILAHRDFENDTPTIVKCDCGRKVYCNDSMTNECEKCGQLFNGSGQALRPESEWEENIDNDY